MTRASPLKTHRRRYGVELCEEKRLFMAFSGKGDGRDRSKVNFDEMPPMMKIDPDGSGAAPDPPTKALQQVLIFLKRQRLSFNNAEPNEHPLSKLLGLGKFRAADDLHNILRSYEPKLVFFSETKKTKAEMEVRGRARGIALLWDKALDMQLLSYTMHHMDVSNLPWLVGGDLNKIFYHEEKLGGLPRPNDEPFVEEHLDRFCGLMEWSLMFQEAYVCHVNWDFSDHLLILLQCFLNSQGRGFGAKKFRFKIAWALGLSCLDTISDAWSKVGVKDAIHNLVIKLEQCAIDLSKWNRDIFGNVQVEIKRLEVQLKEARDAKSRNPFSEEGGGDVVANSEKGDGSTKELPCLEHITFLSPSSSDLPPKNQSENKAVLLSWRRKARRKRLDP
ncbi:hypothetical protein Cgig2_029979 [Carnegiea gigantea]|uniref:Uncharacterized protein n=1 Tax=Carnegiea gigantea TaxID=171969 RepID=A0A9Q1QD94_9CARY|nr:hypothetical protein Cgig2_029979 [Carnegiea gigantea]